MNKNSKRILAGIGIIGLTTGLVLYYKKRISQVRSEREELEKSKGEYLKDSPLVKEAQELEKTVSEVNSEIGEPETCENFIQDVFTESYYCSHLEKDFVDPKEIFGENNNPEGLVHVIQGSKHGSGKHKDFVNFLFEIPKYYKNRNMYPRLRDFTTCFKYLGESISDDIVKFGPRPLRGLVAYIKCILDGSEQIHYLEVPKSVYSSLAHPEIYSDGVASFFELKDLGDESSEVYQSLCSWLQGVYGKSGQVQILSIELMYSMRFGIINGDSSIGMSRKQFLETVDRIIGTRVRGITGSDFSYSGILFHPGNEKDKLVLTEYLDMEDGQCVIKTREL